MGARFDPVTALCLVRETLEGLVDPPTASAIVFEAMARGGMEDLPTDLTAFTEFVEGPLRDAITARVGSSGARVLPSCLSRVVDRVDERQTFRRERSTAKVDVTSGPVRVLVASRGSLAVWLRAALSGERVEIRSSGDVATVTQVQRSFAPMLGVLDATEPPRARDVSELVAWLASLPADGRMIWGVEHKLAAPTIAALEAGDVAFTPVEGRESVEPLLDFVRSRRG